jgi:hypothetical protein
MERKTARGERTGAYRWSLDQGRVIRAPGITAGYSWPWPFARPKSSTNNRACH